MPFMQSHVESLSFPILGKFESLYTNHMTVILIANFYFIWLFQAVDIIIRKFLFHLYLTISNILPFLASAKCARNVKHDIKENTLN